MEIMSIACKFQQTFAFLTLQQLMDNVEMHLSHAPTKLFVQAALHLLHVEQGNLHGSADSARQEIQGRTYAMRLLLMQCFCT